MLIERLQPRDLLPVSPVDQAIDSRLGDVDQHLERDYCARHRYDHDGIARQPQDGGNVRDAEHDDDDDDGDDWPAHDKVQ